MYHPLAPKLHMADFSMKELKGVETLRLPPDRIKDIIRLSRIEDATVPKPTIERGVWPIDENMVHSATIVTNTVPNLFQSICEQVNSGFSQKLLLNAVKRLMEYLNIFPEATLKDERR
jgi:hypothetical protein